MRYIKLKYQDGQIFARINEQIRVGYSRQFNAISIICRDKAIKTELVKDGYTLNEFIDYLEKVNTIFNTN
jgi:hypothetical protein